MFDVGWTELALIAGVALIVMGPEDMPKALYTLGKIVRKGKMLTSDIQKSIDRIMHEAEVDELARTVNEKIGGPNMQFEIERQIQEEDRRMAELEGQNVSRETFTENDK